MKHWRIPVVAASVVLLIGWGLYLTGWLSTEHVRPSQVQSADPMDTPAGWRYRQNQPRHWRYIVLQN